MFVVYHKIRGRYSKLIEEIYLKKKKKQVKLNTKQTISTVQLGGGNIMLWGYFFQHGQGN